MAQHVTLVFILALTFLMIYVYAVFYLKSLDTVLFLNLVFFDRASFAQASLLQYVLIFCRSTANLSLKFA